MAERVQDEAGRWESGNFALGAAVLHSTAESLEAPQPLVSADGDLAVVMDGYLTNWEELRADLTQRGAALRNRSDAELALHAYVQWGEDCADRLEGEFALVIVDQRRHLIYAARDHQGLRPLYVHADQGALLIASDMAAIIAACERKPAPNPDYLAGIVSGHWFQRDATVWRGIERVPQGHWLRFDGTARKVQQYYAVPESVELHYRRDEEYTEHYRAVLTDAVRRTSRTHRRLGITVSGGLDSSAIFGLAHRLERDGRLLAPGFQGYTLAGEPGTDAYELPYARAAARHCGRSLVEVPLFRPDLAWFTARGQADCDVPPPANAAMSIGLEQRASADGARVLLNGVGGDQWLDGTREYYAELAGAFDFSGFARCLARDSRAAGWTATLPVALRFAASAYVPLPLRRLIRHQRRVRCYRDPDDLFWLKPHWRERLLAIEESFTATLPESPRALGNWNRVYSPYHAFAFDLMQRQRARSGIEAREPMLTRQFIAFCAAAPKAIFWQAGLTKVVHRKAMRGIMPDLIVDRTSKGEFSAPPLTQAFAEAALRHADGALAEFCDSTGIRQLAALESHLGIDPERGWELWGCYAVAAKLTNNL